MASEMFALQEVFNGLKLRSRHNLRLNCFAVCDRKPCCLSFLDKNHKPKHLTGDILAREVVQNGEAKQVHALMLQNSSCTD